MSPYQPRTVKQLGAWYASRKQAGKSGFANLEDFLAWYHDQNKICHYCGLSEEESQALVMNGFLLSKRFPQKGVIGRGTSRGTWLEIDRKNPALNYSRENCVLSCYFCNNDKSDIFSAEEYKQFIGDRPGFLRMKLKLLKPG